MKTYSMNDLKPGMQVVFVDHNLNTHPACHVETPLESNAAALAGKLAMVVAVEPDKVGKQVAVCFKEVIAGGHSCDGRVPHGHGAYVLPEHLYSPEGYEQHKVASSAVAAAQKQVDEMLKDFVSP